MTIIQETTKIQELQKRLPELYNKTIMAAKELETVSSYMPGFDEKLLAYNNAMDEYNKVNRKICAFHYEQNNVHSDGCSKTGNYEEKK